MCCYTVFVVFVTFSGHLTVKHHFCLFLVGFEALLADGGEQPSTSGSSGSVYKRTDLSSMLNIYHAARGSSFASIIDSLQRSSCDASGDVAYVMSDMFCLPFGLVAKNYCSDLLKFVFLAVLLQFFSLVLRCFSLKAYGVIKGKYCFCHN